MPPAKILLVDDNDSVREVAAELLETRGFEVVPVSSVNEALQLIVAQKFDALVTDLHMPSPGDGYAVVTAMHHAQPNVLTIVTSGYPDTDRAMADIVLQADHIFTKPVDFGKLAGLIRERLTSSRPAPIQTKRQTVATILERESLATIHRWLSRVEKVPELASITVEDADRVSYLPEILRNIVSRLRGTRDLEGQAAPSAAAVEHGLFRYSQGYTAPLIVQESRILQVCIFETIKQNLVNVDFSSVLPDVMLIADEVDAQLTLCIDSFLQAKEQALTKSA